MDKKNNFFVFSISNFLDHQGHYVFFILSFLMFTFYSQIENIAIRLSPAVLINTPLSLNGTIEKISKNIIKIKQNEPYSIAEAPINIKQNSYYIVIINQESEGGFLFDFFSHIGYDNAQQERYVSPTRKRSLFSIFSGQPPNDVLFRIHFSGKYDVILHDIRILEAPTWYKYRNYILFSGFGLLLISFGIMLRENPVKRRCFCSQ